MDVCSLPGVYTNELDGLPDFTGVYIVVDSEGMVAYIGKAKSIKSRWINHHRKYEVLQIKSAKIVWIAVRPYRLAGKLEQHLIRSLKPYLNGTRVQHKSGSRWPLLVYFTEVERSWLQALSDEWGVSLSGAVRRLLRERKDDPIIRDAKVRYECSRS